MFLHNKKPMNQSPLTSLLSTLYDTDAFFRKPNLARFHIRFGSHNNLSGKRA